MAQLEILNPVAELVQNHVPPAPRLASLAGRTIGLYWNMKAGGDVALSAVADALSRKHGRVSFRRYTGSVGSSVRLATSEDVQRMATECDAVVGTTSD